MARRKLIKKTPPIDNVRLEKLRRNEITPDVIKEASDFYLHGLTEFQIAAYYGMNGNEWSQLKKAKPELMLAMEHEKTVTIREVANLLLEKARSGNVTAMIFYLKCHGGYKDNGEIVKSFDAKAEINFSLTTNDPVEASRIYQKIMTGGS